MKIIRRAILTACALGILCSAMPISAQDSARTSPGNDPAREQWFMDQALGMFIHWSLDSQLGSVISHSMVGASDDYNERFINELPKTFNPTRYDPDEWVRMAKVCGVKYMVFTTKHHSGFCMWDTKTTDFSIMKTPYAKDITKQFVDACRKEGMGVGFYFSPDDFWMLHQQGITIDRRKDEVQPSNNPKLMEHNLAQLRELLTNYGDIDVLFLDGDPNQLKELAWQMQPKILVTRGAMQTPEQKIPDAGLPGPWEACYTLGTQWQFKPTNETYKSGTDLIRMLAEIRAKGGNFLLNVGPQPDGVIPFEQQRRFMEMGLWLFINHESMYEIRPWNVTHEGDGVWYTKDKDSNTVYAIVHEFADRAEWHELTLKNVRAGDGTQVQILGQSDKAVEYQPTINPAATFEQTADGLKIRAMRAQRIYNNDRNGAKAWPNPVVLRITNAQMVGEAAATPVATPAGPGYVDEGAEPAKK